jgi:hypothetical protein
LAYVARPRGATESIVKLAYPEVRELPGTESDEDSYVFWSPHSDWLAVARYIGSSMEFVIFSLPGFKVTHFGTDEVWSINIKPLHDGSLAYIDDDRVFLWRTGWQEPVCIYDPGRETVKVGGPGGGG